MYYIITTIWFIVYIYLLYKLLKKDIKNNNYPKHSKERFQKFRKDMLSSSIHACLWPFVVVGLIGVAIFNIITILIPKITLRLLEDKDPPIKPKAQNSKDPTDAIVNPYQNSPNDPLI